MDANCRIHFLDFLIHVGLRCLWLLLGQVQMLNAWCNRCNCFSNCCRESFSVSGDVVGQHPCMSAPENVTSQWLPKNGVNISWTHRHHHHHHHPHHHHHHHHHPHPGCKYEIEYRTVGQWVPLTHVINVTWYMWKTASHGTIYYFRVISQDHTSTVHSPPSVPVFIETGGILCSQVYVTLAVSNHYY